MRARRRGEFTLPELQAMMSSGSCAQAQNMFRKAKVLMLTNAEDCYSAHKLLAANNALQAAVSQ